jgi:hypothetical protein
MPPVYYEHQAMPRADDSYKPILTARKRERKGNLALTGFRQNAHKLNNILVEGLSSKRILPFQSDQILGVAACHYRFKRQLPTQLDKKLSARTGFSDDQCSCRADIHDIIGGQVSGEHAGAKSPVSSHVDSPEENKQSHTAFVEAIMTASTMAAVSWFPSVADSSLVLSKTT